MLDKNIKYPSEFEPYDWLKSDGIVNYWMANGLILPHYLCDTFKDTFKTIISPSNISKKKFI